MFERMPAAVVHRAVLWVLLGFLPLGSARADDAADRIQALEKRLETSTKLIEALAARVAELERGNKAPVAPPAAVLPAAAAASQAEAARAIAALQDDVNQISEGLSRRGLDSGLPIHGFADVTAGWSSLGDPARLRGFNAGTLDLYLTPQFGDRVRSLIEIAIEYDRDGGSTVDMERLQLGYTVSDALTLWLGRFHTPFGLWNTSFHHGANLQTSITRPRFVDFEDKGGIIPAHSVGFWGTGKMALGPGKITYDAYVSNGPSIRKRELDLNPFTDDSNGKMLGFNLGYQPAGALHGATVGLHGFGSTVNTYATSAALLRSTRLRMLGAYLGYDANDWEVISEYYHFANADAGDRIKRHSNAWFAHVGKTYGALTPFVRYERAALDPADDYFLSQETGRSYRRVVLGARYALDTKASFKLEWSTTREAGALQLDEFGMRSPFAAARYRRFEVQYSIAF